MQKTSEGNLQKSALPFLGAQVESELSGTIVTKHGAKHSFILSFFLGGRAVLFFFFFFEMEILCTVAGLELVL